MIRILRMWRLRWRKYMLIAQLEHVEEQLITGHQVRGVLRDKLRRTCHAILAAEQPANLLTQALRRAGRG